MGLFDGASASDALADLLDREGVAAREGRFDVLDRLAAEKDRLLKALAAEGADGACLARLKRRGERNARLLEAMQGGVTAAMQRLDAIRTGPAPLQTYSASGRRQDMGAVRSRMEHRA